VSRIGIAVIGAGFIADYHLTSLAAVPRAETRVIASRTLAKAQALAARHGVPIATDDIEAALARSDIDAVVITTPDENHEEHAILAARAGKAILLQKPMSTTSASCSRIIAAASNAKVDLQVSFMHRYFEEVEAARELLASQAIGAVTSVRIRNATPGPDWNDWFFKRDCVSGGAVLQLGTHGIDLIEYLIGSIVAVGARTATLQPRRKLRDGRTIDVENPDSAWCVYDLAGGAVASHEVSMIEIKGCDRFRLEIYGSEGTLWLRSERGPLAIHAPHLGRDDWHVPKLPDALPGQRQHQRWIDGLAGDALREETAFAGLRGLLVAEAIMRSAARDGCREPVEQAAIGVFP
jgi:predicted dehydrogenase